MLPEVVAGRWKTKRHQIYKLNEGEILALELDPDNNSDGDTLYTEGRQLSRVKDKRNRLYIVDDQPNMTLLEEDEEEENHYSVVEVTKLGGLKNFAAELIEYKRKPFSSMSITSRCLTLNETNYNFANKTTWKLEIKL